MNFFLKRQEKLLQNYKTKRPKDEEVLKREIARAIKTHSDIISIGVAAMGQRQRGFDVEVAKIRRDG